MRFIGWTVILLACGLGLGGCEREPAPPAKLLRLATTTSTENSGLLDVLLPASRERTGIEVQVMPMGTGKALRTARDGNCDVVLVHAPEAEADFVRAGWGVNRRGVMYNDFVLLGPAGDPAGVRGCGSAAEAMRRIAAARAAFVSRGDGSGTHRKEMALWRVSGVSPSGPWYRSVGQGMGQALTMADEMRAYVLADRGTFLKFREGLDLTELFSADAALHNPYSAIAVNPADAEALGVADGQRVRVKSRRGQIEIDAHLTDRVAAGTTFLAFHYREAPANRLTIAALDPIAKIPEYKVCAVSIQPCGAE